MRHFVALAALAALFSIGSNTAHAALVAGFNAGQTTDLVNVPGLVVSTTQVMTNNGLADASSGLITTVEAGSTTATFNGSFASFQPLDLILFEFAAMPDSDTFGFSATLTASGVGSVSNSGTISGVTGGSTSTISLDTTSLGGVNFADIQVTLTGAKFVDVSPNTLPFTGYSGFAAVTAVPEPSMIAGLAVLSGAGFLVHRRRRQTAAKA